LQKSRWPSEKLGNTPGFPSSQELTRMQIGDCFVGKTGKASGFSSSQRQMWEVIPSRKTSASALWVTRNDNRFLVEALPETRIK